MALPQHNRLRASRDFNRVYRKGKRAATKHLAVRALKISTRVSALGSPVIKRPVKANVTRQRQSLKSAGGHSSALLLRSSVNKTGADEAGRHETGRHETGNHQNSLSGPRFGISISKKVHKRAVVRNRIKRQIKAIIRERYTAIAPEWQIVIIVRPPAVECSFDDFLRELEYLLQKLSVLSQTT